MGNNFPSLNSTEAAPEMRNYRSLRDRPHPLQLVWDQAVTSQASWGLEVLFGFRGGARRGGVSWKSTRCCKTGTFPHLFSREFHQAWEKGPQQPGLGPLEGSSQLHSRRVQASRAPARFNSQSVSSSQKRGAWLWSHMLQK